jgi:sec-independent protein translocase protein TatB
MFDVGFWEILLILVLALVVIGPERLPGAARKAGYFVGKARRYIEGVRSEVESEIDVSEFKRILHNQEVQINELQQQLKAGVDDVRSDLPDDISVSDVLEDSPTHSFSEQPASGKSTEQHSRPGDDPEESSEESVAASSQPAKKEQD